MRLARRSNTKTSGDGDQVDLTPMLDVVFILVVFFVVTAVFIDETAVREYSSHTNAKSLEDRGTFVIEIKESGAIWVEDRHVSVRAIRALAAQAFAKFGSNLVISINAEALADVSVYVAVVGELRKFGTNNIVLRIVEPE